VPAQSKQSLRRRRETNVSRSENIRIHYSVDAGKDQDVVARTSGPIRP